MGLSDMPEVRRSVPADGHLMACARAARLEMFALLALDRVESSHVLGREVLTHVRDRDGPARSAWVREALALAGAWDGSSDSDLQEAFADCAGVYRGAPALRQHRFPSASAPLKWCILRREEELRGGYPVPHWDPGR